MRHKGIHHQRLRRNHEERRFAEAWEQDNEKFATLAHLLVPPSSPAGNHFGSIENVDPVKVEVAATIIQWLGSPVGQGFLLSLGYEKKR